MSIRKPEGPTNFSAKSNINPSPPLAARDGGADAPGRRGIHPPLQLAAPPYSLPFESCLDALLHGPTSQVQCRLSLSSTMRRAAHPSGFARCGAVSGYSAIKKIFPLKYQSLFSPACSSRRRGRTRTTRDTPPPTPRRSTQIRF